MTCVCSHRRWVHEKVKLSVELPTPHEPIYPLPPDSFIARKIPTASYHEYCCRDCGCGTYEEDTEGP